MVCRDLEHSIIEMLREINISSTEKEGLTGVWVDDHKIAALGVRLSRWVSMHGFAINIHTDLSLYRGSHVGFLILDLLQSLK